MSKYLLDTSIVVFLFRDKYKVAERIKEVGVGNCYISEITIAELQTGIEKSSTKHFNQQLLDELLEKVNTISFSSVIKRFAKEKVALNRRGISVDDFDLLIGCSALENNLILVTDNLKHFKDIPALQIENWVERNVSF